jgi:2-dehydro-3-deoxyphosphogluconate aldolase / (4S)-4-hydroxy-2-oxoglutarate aldolase
MSAKDDAQRRWPAVLPVVTVEAVADALPLAQALVDGGVRAMEITLRTPAALHAIEIISRRVPQMRVGAGTVLSARMVSAASAAGAQFLVTPGTTERLLDAMQESGLQLLPGVATPAEVLRLLERGLTEMKLYPAAVLGGLEYLSALSQPLPAAKLCPSGGIEATTAPDYLALPNVICVAGSWLATASAIAEHDWAGIEQRAAHAASL